MGTPLISFLSDPYSYVVENCSEIFTSNPRHFHGQRGGHLDFDLGHVTCFGQWDVNQYDRPKAPKASVRLGMFSCASGIAQASPAVPGGG